MTSNSQPLFFDIIVKAISFIEEAGYMNLRLVNHEWNDAVGANLSTRHATAIPDMIRRRRFMSAMNAILVGSSKGNRRVRPNKVLIAASEIPHVGIIRYILSNYPKLKGGPCIDNLFMGEIGRANLLAMVEFYKYGRRDNRINIHFAAKHNCIELAEVLDIDSNRDSFGINIAFDEAVKNNNPRMAEIISKSKYFQRRTEYEILNLINKNVEIAMICIQEISPKLAFSLDQKIGDEPKYSGIKAALKPHVDEYIEAEKRRKERETFLQKILYEVKKKIVRALVKKYPSIKIHNARINWRIGAEDIVKIDWGNPWGYSYTTNSPRQGIDPTEIYVNGIYNLAECADDIRLTGPYLIVPDMDFAGNLDSREVNPCRVQ